MKGKQRFDQETNLLAPIYRRLLAHFVDVLIIFTPTWLFHSLTYDYISELIFESEFLNFELYRIYYFSSYIIVYLLYCIVFESSKLKNTPGKKHFHIE